MDQDHSGREGWYWTTYTPRERAASTGSQASNDLSSQAPPPSGGATSMKAPDLPARLSGLDIASITSAQPMGPRDPLSREETSSSRFLYMFLCFSKRVFCAKIEVQNELIDDDPKVFKKMRESYSKARGLLGGLSLIHSLTGIRHVKATTKSGRHLYVD